LSVFSATNLMGGAGRQAEPARYRWQRVVLTADGQFALLPHVEDLRRSTVIVSRHLGIDGKLQQVDGHGFAPGRLGIKQRLGGAFPAKAAQPHLARCHRHHMTAPFGRSLAVVESRITSKSSRPRASVESGRRARARRHERLQEDRGALATHVLDHIG